MYMHIDQVGTQGRPSNEIRIKKLAIMETGGYNRQYRRPYETMVDGQVMSMLAERISNISSQAEITPRSFTGVANHLLKPSATPEGQIHIENGWEERRARFMMEIEYGNPLTTSRTVQILGSTDYFGLTGSAIDPNMVFTINSITALRTTHARTPGGGLQTYRNVVESAQILAKQMDGGDMNSYVPNIYDQRKDYRLRPADVFATMTHTHLMPEQLAEIVDTRTLLSTTPVRSNRTNNLATNFAADMVSNYYSAAQGFQLGESEAKVYGAARSTVIEQSTQQDPFMAAIAQLQGVPAGINSFRFRDLLRLDPQIDDKTVVMIFDSKAKAVAHYAGMSSDWGGTDFETQMATILAQSVPCLLAEHGLTALRFRVTNDTIGSQFSFQPYGAASFAEGMDLSPAVESFWNRFLYEVLLDLSYNNQVLLYLDVQCELHGETRFNIRVDHNPETLYVVPQFADARFTPLVTSNNQRLVGIASDFQQVFTDVMGVDKGPIGGISEYGF